MSEHDDLPILRALRDDLATAYAARGAAPRRRPMRRRVPRGFVALVAAGATAFAAVLVALPAGHPSALSVLDATAATAAAQPKLALAVGTYAYFRERSTAGSTTDPIATGHSIEWWVARDGSGRVRETMSIDNPFERPTDGVAYVVRPSTDRPLQPWRHAGTDRWFRDARFGPGQFDAIHNVVSPGVLSPGVDGLPTDPVALEAELMRQLRAAARDGDPETGFRGPIDQWDLLIVVEQTLAHPLASPELRSALFRLAATFDGVTVTEGTKDPAARPATVLVATGGTEKTEIFFDPKTAASLAARDTSTEHGTTAQTWLYTPPETVDSATSRP